MILAKAHPDPNQLTDQLPTQWTDPSAVLAICQEELQLLTLEINNNNKQAWFNLIVPVTDVRVYVPCLFE